MFKPVYSIINDIANSLVCIEQLKNKIEVEPITMPMLAKLRATARLETIHYSVILFVKENSVVYFDFMQQNLQIAIKDFLLLVH